MVAHLSEHSQKALQLEYVIHIIKYILKDRRTQPRICISKSSTESHFIWNHVLMNQNLLHPFNFLPTLSWRKEFLGKNFLEIV